MGCTVQDWVWVVGGGPLIFLGGGAQPLFGDRDVCFPGRPKGGVVILEV